MARRNGVAGKIVTAVLVALAFVGCGGDKSESAFGPNAEKLDPTRYPCSKVDLHARISVEAVVERGDIAELDGTGSRNPDSGALQYAWSVQGPSGPVDLYAKDLPSVGFHADEPGKYTATLTVRDACQTSDPTSASFLVVNDAPVAKVSAPYGDTFRKRDTLRLDASETSDPNFNLLTFAWSVVSGPPGAQVTFTPSDSQWTDFSTDVAGDYVVSITADDGYAKGTATVTVHVTNTQPVASAQGHAEGSTELPVAFTSNGSTDADEDPLSYQWTVVEKPAGSDPVLSDPSGAQTNLVTSLEGRYTLELVVHDGTVASAPARRTVAVSRFVQRLTHDVVDAEYSTALERIVAVSALPSNALALYDPVGRTEQTVALTHPPVSVGVSPDGKRAAVGHADGFVSLVNLETLAAPTVVTLPLGTTSGGSTKVVRAGDVVHAGTHVYVFPGDTFGMEKFYTVNVTTNAVTVSSAGVYDQKVKRHPASGLVYAVEDSFGDLARYKPDSNGTLQFDREGTAPTNRETCGDLWFVAADRFLTACGSIFSATAATRSTDPEFTYVGLLVGYDGGYYRSLRSASRAGALDRIATVVNQHSNISPWLDDTSMQLHKASDFTLEATIALPHFVSAGVGRDGHGRFVFHSADGSRRFVVLQTDDYQLSKDWGVVAY